MYFTITAFVIGGAWIWIYVWLQVPCLIRCISGSYKEVKRSYPRLLFSFTVKQAQEDILKELRYLLSILWRKKRGSKLLCSYSVPSRPCMFSSLSPRDSSMRRAPLSFPFYRWGNRGSERMNLGDSHSQRSPEGTCCVPLFSQKVFNSGG